MRLCLFSWGVLWNHLHLAYSILKVSKFFPCSPFLSAPNLGMSAVVVTLEVINSSCNRWENWSHSHRRSPSLGSDYEWCPAHFLSRIHSPLCWATNANPQMDTVFVAPASLPDSHLVQPCGQEEGGKMPSPSAPEMGILSPTMHINWSKESRTTSLTAGHSPGQRDWLKEWAFEPM